MAGGAFLAIPAVVAGVIAGILIERWRDRAEDEAERHRRDDDDDGGIRPPPPRHRIPSTFDAPALVTALVPRLAGTALAGTAASGSAPPAAVIWADAGSEVLVHLDSLQTRLLPGTLLVSVDLESDQTGRGPVVVSFALGGPGDPVITARWGRAVQLALWQSLLSLAADHAHERGAAARGIAVTAGQLELHEGAPLQLAASA